jgi:adenylate cyclase
MGQQSAGPSRYPVPDMPSIAVLPFQSMSSTAWSRTSLPACPVSSAIRDRRNSRLTYKGQAVDVKRIGRELGVRYVL